MAPQGIRTPLLLADPSPRRLGSTSLSYRWELPFNRSYPFGPVVPELPYTSSSGVATLDSDISMQYISLAQWDSNPRFQHRYKFSILSGWAEYTPMSEGLSPSCVFNSSERTEPKFLSSPVVSSSQEDSSISSTLNPRQRGLFCEVMCFHNLFAWCSIKSLVNNPTIRPWPIWVWVASLDNR